MKNESRGYNYYNFSHSRFIENMIVGKKKMTIKMSAYLLTLYSVV